MTKRAPFRPVRDSLGVPCPQLYITQYARPDGTCDLQIRTDEHNPSGKDWSALEVLTVSLGHPWQTSPDDACDSLADVMWHVEEWLVRWFGVQLTLLADPADRSRGEGS